MKLPVLLRLLLLAVLLCGMTWPVPAMSNGTVVYTDKEFGFRVEYPGQWVQKELQDPAPIGAYMRLTIALINEKEVSMCSFSATSFEISKQYPLTDIISRMMEPRLFEETLHETMPRGRVLNLQRGLLGGKDASIALVANTVPVRQFMINYTGVMATTVYNGYLYRGYCCSDEKTFPKMEKELRSILDKFSFTQAKASEGSKINDTLVAMAAQQQATLPMKLDEMTTLVGVHAEGAVMTYRYVLGIDRQKDGDLAGFKKAIKETMCSPELKMLLKAGGTFRFIYEDRKSKPIDTVLIQNGDCL